MRTERYKIFPQVIKSDILDEIDILDGTGQWKIGDVTKDTKGYQVDPKLCSHFRQYFLKDVEGALSRLQSKLMSVIVECNNRAWQYDIEGFAVPDFLHMIAYCGKHKHHFSWHIDHGDYPLPDPRHYLIRRKLSFTVPLTDPSLYKGGDFSVDRDRTIDRLNVGDLLIWPSHVPNMTTKAQL